MSVKKVENRLERENEQAKVQRQRTAAPGRLIG
jgi:hypothetical protein